MLDIGHAVEVVGTDGVGRDDMHRPTTRGQPGALRVGHRLIGSDQRAARTNGESLGDVQRVRPLHVGVVRPGVGHHGDRGLDDPLLSDPLEVRLDGHALEHDGLRSEPGGPAQGSDELPDVRPAIPGNGRLAAVGQHQSGSRTGRLSDRPDPVLAQDGDDQTRDARFATGAVHVHADRDAPDGPSVDPPLQMQGKRNSHTERRDDPKHVRQQPESPRAKPCGPGAPTLIGRPPAGA